jgi:hypothetical protein
LLRFLDFKVPNPVPTGNRYNESFSGVLDYRSFPVGVTQWRAALEKISRPYNFPRNVRKQVVLLALDCLRHDRVFALREVVGATLPVPKRSYDILPHLTDAVELHMSIDFAQEERDICSQIKSAMKRFGCRPGAAVFVVGGVTGFLKMPPVSILDNHGTLWAMKFWNIMSALGSNLNSDLFVLGVGICPRDNPPDLDRHALAFLTELCRLHDVAASSDIRVRYRDIYTPSSFQEFNQDSAGGLIENEGHIQRFVNDLEIVIGEAMQI